MTMRRPPGTQKNRQQFDPQMKQLNALGLEPGKWWTDLKKYEVRMPKQEKIGKVLEGEEPETTPEPPASAKKNGKKKKRNRKKKRPNFEVSAQ